MSRDKRALDRLSAVQRHNQAQKPVRPHSVGPTKGQQGTVQRIVGTAKDQGYVAQQLKLILDDPNGSTASKASAARTLAEIEGLIGRHQQAPARTQDKGLGELTRAELVQELERLRALVQAP